VNPFLTGGAGQLTWGEAGESEAPRPKDQTALIVGGGLEFNLGPNLRATVAARNFILAGSDLFASPDLQTISDPDELVHNWQFSGGLKLLVGRSGIRSGTRVAEAWEPTPVQPAPARPAAPTPARWAPPRKAAPSASLPEHPPRQLPGDLPIPDGGPAVHEHVDHPFRQLMRLGEGGLVPKGFQVEHHHVRRHPLR